MTIAVGVNKENGRRVVLLTLDPREIPSIGDCIILSTEEHIGFPDDLEIVLNIDSLEETLRRMQAAGAISDETRIIRDPKL